MSIQEYQVRRSRHIPRIKMLRKFGMPPNMIENEQWLLAMARIRFYHPSRVVAVEDMVDRFVTEKLLAV